jgi:hypothetical protein
MRIPMRKPMLASTRAHVVIEYGGVSGMLREVTLVPDMTCPAGAYGAATTVALGPSSGVTEVIIG